MKNSIEKILKNLSLFMLLATLTVGAVALLVSEHNNSYAKINNIKNQKLLVNYLANLQQDDYELTFIQFNGKSTQLQYEIDKLYKLNKYDYTGEYILNHSKEFTADLNKLKTLINSFNSATRKYYEKDMRKNLKAREIRELKKLKLKDKKLFKQAHYSIVDFLDKMVVKHIKYLEDKFHLLEKTALFSFGLIFLGLLFYSQRLRSINKDIRHLYAVEKDKNYKVFSIEADAIKLRMGRKQVVSENPDMMDSVTQVYNYKGLMASHNNNKGLKENFFTTVTVFEIDNFSKQNRAFNQEFTQAVLKKVAFTISLQEQATDIVARTDYNQFTAIITRSTKEQAFKDVDIIRQSIPEIKFTTPDGDNVIITVCGGSVLKANNKPLDDAIRTAKDILVKTKANGKNTVSQEKDFARKI